MPKLITIIGQKEVGKTTLFRQVIKKYSTNASKNISPLVNYTEELINIKSNVYRLVDTPSFVFSPKTEIEKGVRNQIEELLKKSDLILWTIDKIEEKTLLLSRYLRKTKIPQILLINKADLVDSEEVINYHQILKPNYFLPISALKNTNLDKLADKIIDLLPSPSDKISSDVDKKNSLNLLIFGPPNSGKSTLMNYLLKENRSLSTPIAGTTQEPVISPWKWKEINFQLVDTAGITKNKRINKELWNKCDLVWATIDATSPLTKQILQIVNLGEKYSKPLIIIVNKCDLVKDEKILIRELRNRIKSLSYCPVVYLSALKGFGVGSLMKTLGKMLEQAQKSVGKKELGEVIEKMIKKSPPNYYQGGKLKIYFAKQESGLAPCFIIFINNPKWVHFSYQRYMVNYLRKNLGLEYLPIKIILKKSV